MKIIAAICGALIMSFVAALPAAAKKTVTFTDISGRSVEVQVPVDHLILGEGRFLPTLAILDRADPTRRVVGMMAEFQRLDPAGYAHYLKRFPHLADIPKIGFNGSETFSIEKAITVKPDVAIFGLNSGHGPSDRNRELLAQLDAAGIPVVVVDFRYDPLVNTPKSIELLGRLLGREKEAAEFLDFYGTQLNLVSGRLKDVTEKPRVFLEIWVGMRDQCCEAMGNSMMGRFIEKAGGVNAFGDKIPGARATVNLEHLMISQPDVYIGTAIGAAGRVDKESKRIVLGPATDRDMAQTSFRRAMTRTGFEDLKAVRAGRAHAIWHHFYNTPMNVAAVQAMAKWIHPDRFADVDPRKTLEIYFDRFQPFPADGVYWTSLEDK